MLSNFRLLRYLSLKSTQPMIGYPSKWQLTLRSLSPTLETLCINSLDAHTLFLDDYEAEYAYGDLHRGQKRIDLGSIVPSLTRLEMHPGTENKLVPYLNEYDMAGLPSTLKEFKAHVIVLDRTNIWRLPRSLERLEATLLWNDANTDGDHLLPPHLSFIAELRPMNPARAYGPTLPPSMHIGHIDFDSWTGELIARLPTTIDSISIINSTSNSFEGLGTNWIGSVPRSVKSLTIHFSGYGPSLSPSDLSHLPPNLTKLTLENHPIAVTLLRDALRRGVDVSSLWPKTLQTLVIDTDCISDDLKLLPATLKTLTIEFSDRFGMIQLKSSSFPPNLTRFALGTSPLVCFSVVGGNLPSTLTTLDIAQFPRRSLFNIIDRATIEKTLPSSLTDLTFAMPDHPSPDSTPWTLPLQLVTLNMECWRVKWLESLPRQLTSLSISDLCGIPEALAVGPFDLFEHLPASLAILMLDIYEPEDLDDEAVGAGKLHHAFEVPSLASLTHLHHLDCSPSLTFAPSTLSYIPRSLRYLQMNVEGGGHQFPSWLRYTP